MRVTVGNSGLCWCTSGGVYVLCVKTIRVKTHARWVIMDDSGLCWCTSGGVYVLCIKSKDACQVSYHRRLRSLLLYLCYLFRALINSLVCCFLLYSQQKRQNNSLHIQPWPLAAEQASKFPAQQYFELVNPFNASQRHCPASAVLFQEQLLGDITVTRNAHFENYAGTDTGLPITGRWLALCQGHCMTQCSWGR